MKKLMFADIGNNLGKLTIPIMIIVVFVAILFLVWAMLKRYKRIPPNAIGVIYGKRRTEVTGPNGEKTSVGFKLVSGGAVFILPIVEAYEQMSTEAFQIEIEEKIFLRRKTSASMCRV